MNLSERDIEWIVGEVVRRLALLSAEPKTADLPTLSDKVITLETLKKHAGSSELAVTTKAIVTPAARDELKRRGIRLIRQDATNKPTANATNPSPASKNRLLAANIGADYQPKMLAQLLSGDGASLEQHPANALETVVLEHGKRVASEKCKAIWFTSQPAHAVCLANRQSGVWAVVGSDVESLTAALKHTAINVLAIDPRKKSQYLLRQMLALYLPT